MLNKIILSMFILLGIGNTQEIEGRWIPGGFSNTMYEFVDTEPFAEAGLRYTYYCPNENGCDESYWSSLDTSDAIPNPNPYSVSVDGNTLSIDTFFGNISTYELGYRCDGQVVDFYYDEDDWVEGLHSTMYRLGFDDFNNDCLEPNPDDCLCTEQWDPVCGIDGNTYDNPCFATCQYVVIAYEGECLVLNEEIEGRWHLVGFEDAIMYEFVDTEPFADAGLRYSIYVDENGEFDDLDGDNIGGTPHPYSVVGDIITIDTHFGNILSYQMNFRCDGQVVEFIDIDYNAIHSTLFKEGFDYFNSDCEQVLEECFDFTDIDFGDCLMVLGIGFLNGQCDYISGCDWTIGGIDYSDLFFDSIEECQEVCSGNNDCFITSDDILGPYYFEDAPFRSVIAHADEPGQRLFISGNVMQNDCENFISGSLIEIWQANDEGCYGIVEDCDTGNPENDYFNLRGKFFSDENGDYTFESILPGYYGSRPRHIHIKITTPNGEELVSQLYFENDPYCENDQWCQDADDRIIPIIEDEYGLHGEIDLIMNSTENGISLGDINFDNLLNVQDIVLLVGIILNNSIPNDFQIYSGDINNDNNIDILDIVQLVAIILN